MSASAPSAPESDPPRRRSVPALFLQPKVGIPLAVLAILFCAPFAWRQSRVAGIPDIGPPFDLEKDGTVSLAEADNAIVEYRLAGGLVRDLSGTDQSAYDTVREKGWSEATDSLARSMSRRGEPVNLMLALPIR